MFFQPTTLRTAQAIVAAFGIAGLATLAAPPTAAAAAEPASGEDGRLMLVLDSSGSMSEPATGGTTKIAAAKQSLRTVVRTLPADAQVGLRVYGADVFSQRQPGACTDSEQVVDIGTGNRSELRSAIGSYRPYGETPIGYALEQAAADLGSEGQRTIVLVSDGEATCPPPPCEVARDIAKQGIDIRIDVVGLDVGAEARRQLECIATIGRGTYYDVDDADDLTDALTTLSTRAFRPFQLQGERVQGTTEPADAPVLTAGQYVTDMGPDGTFETFTLRRAIPGSTLHVGVSGLTPDFTDGLQMAAFPLPLPDSEFDNCGRKVPGFGLERGDDLFGTSLTIGAGSYANDEECADGDVLLYLERGQRTSGFGGDSPIDVELLIIEEPPVSTVSGLPEGVLDSTWTTPGVSGPGQRLIGGASFSDAPTVVGQRVRGNVVPGETQVYRVPLDWGQSGMFQVQFPRRGVRLGEAIGYLGVSVSVRAFGPARGELDRFPDNGPDPLGTLNGVDPLTLGTATPVLRYRNREEPSDASRATSIPGFYYVAVSTSADSDGESYTIPYELTVDVVGEPDGAPDYVGETEEEPSVSPPTASTEPPTTVPESSPPAEDPAEDPAESSAEEPGDEPFDGSIALLAAGVGAAGLVALGSAVALWRRPGG